MTSFAGQVVVALLFRQEGSPQWRVPFAAKISSSGLCVGFGGPQPLFEA